MTNATPPPDAPPAGGGRHRVLAPLLRRLALSGLSLACAVAALAVGTAWAVGTAHRAHPLPTPNLVALDRRLAVARAFDELALPTRPEPDPRGVGEMVAGLGRDPSSLHDPCAEAPTSSPLAGRGMWPCLDHRAAFPAAERGLSEAERRHVERFLDHPALPVLEALARAEGYDPPLRSGVSGTPEGAEPAATWEVAAPKLAGLRLAAYAGVAGAALRFDDGDPAAAETDLRGLVSAGRLLARDGRTLVEALVGAVILRAGLDGLIQLYEAWGREGDAREIARRIAAEEEEDDEPPGPAASREGRLRWLEKRLADPSLPRGLVFEGAFLSVLGRSCGGPRAVLLGPPARHDRLMREVREARVRYPADRQLFDLLDSSMRDLHERSGPWSPAWDPWTAERPWWAPWAAVAAELSAALLRNPRVDGCYEIAMMRR